MSRFLFCYDTKALRHICKNRKSHVGTIDIFKSLFNCAQLSYVCVWSVGDMECLLIQSASLNLVSGQQPWPVELLPFSILKDETSRTEVCTR